MKRVEANDADTMDLLADGYHCGEWGLQQNRAKAMELYAKAAELGSSDAHFSLGNTEVEGFNLSCHRVRVSILSVLRYCICRQNQRRRRPEDLSVHMMTLV